LGQILEARGVAGYRCVHFDFGENLRRIVECDRADEIVSRDDIEFLRRVLETGALLEDKDFPIAERILRRFLVRCSAKDGMLVVLNGLPRHAGQAEAVARMVEIRTVMELACTPETVLARIGANTGGDRTDRRDDELSDIRRKLAIYAKRTQPLVDYFAARGIRIVHQEVAAEMTPEQMWQALDGALREGCFSTGRLVES
jgi:adenylate kinase family enzyme